jgi:hypothetical protein
LDTLPYYLRPYAQRRFETKVAQFKGGDELLADNWCHDWVRASVLECIDVSRPSKYEVIALIYTMLESMIRAKTLIHGGEQRDYIPLFQVNPTFYQYISLMQYLQWMKDITLVCDFSGRCRVLTGYYNASSILV